MKEEKAKMSGEELILSVANRCQSIGSFLYLFFILGAVCCVRFIIIFQTNRTETVPKIVHAFFGVSRLQIPLAMLGITLHNLLLVIIYQSKKVIVKCLYQARCLHWCGHHGV